MSSEGPGLPATAPREAAPVKIPTIHDVARMAGVTTSTVSRALRGEPRVNAATRERVRQVADELLYRPSRSAQSLRSRNTRTIGLLATNLDNPIAIDHLRATVRAAFEVGYTVFVADGQDSPEIQDAELARMLDYRVDGLVLGRGTFCVTPNLVRAAAAGVPLEPDISAERLRRDLGRFITGYPERTELDAAAAIIAYRRLVELGHRRYAMFVHTLGAFAESRRSTLEDTLARLGVDDADIVTVDIERLEECVGEVQALAVRPLPPTVFISGKGSLTPFLLEGLQLAGLRIPQDVSFLSFGDSAWHRAYSPPISVIRHDYVAAARRSLERLIGRIEGGPVKDSPRRSSEFIPRGSFGPVPNGPSAG